MRTSLNKVSSVLEEIRNYEQRFQRPIQVVAATKYVDSNIIKQLLEAGLTDIGENKVQDAFIKKASLEEFKFNFHLLGHLQSNKIKKAVSIFDMIQSVDSFELAKKISLACVELQKEMPILLEVNVVQDQNKFGFDPKTLLQNFDKILALPNLKIEGIMSMIFQTNVIEKQRRYFSSVKLFFDDLRQKYPSLKVLSMGTSDDYCVAIQEGSTMVRLGRVLFDEAKSEL